MNDILRQLLIICPLIFLAGFVDAVAGGGGLISLPAYMLAGLPTHQAAGCNKFSACLGTITATLKYITSGKVKWRIAIFAAMGAMAGSSVGTNLALFISDRTLRWLMMVAIPIVAVFLVVKKDLGSKARETGKSPKEEALLSIVIGLFIGCYDGLIGPGTGTFLIIAFSGVLGLELVTSSGCAKVANLSSNITSMIIYALGGKIILYLAVPAACCSIVGGYLGAKFAIKGGASRVRYIMFVIIGLMFAKTIMDLWR